MDQGQRGLVDVWVTTSGYMAVVDDVVGGYGYCHCKLSIVHRFEGPLLGTCRFAVFHLRKREGLPCALFALLGIPTC